jgi:hypothetical protein
VSYNEPVNNECYIGWEGIESMPKLDGTAFAVRLASKHIGKHTGSREKKQAKSC